MMHNQQGGQADSPGTPDAEIDKEHLRTLLDHVADGVFVVDVADGRFLDVNRHACESLGYSRDELLSMCVSDIDHEAEARNDKGEIWDKLQPGKPATFEGVHRRKDGLTFPVELRCDLMDIDGRKCLLGIARDISDRKKTEAALREGEQSLRSLIASMTEGLCLHELVFDDAGNAVDYRILDVNPAYERILSMRREEAIGSLASEFYGAGEAPYLPQYAEVALTGKPYSFETYFPPLDRHFSISVFCPGPNRFGTVFTDITDRKRSELEREQLVGELEAKNAELERFTYTVSHDLKSPLITIRGYLGLLEEDFADRDFESASGDFQRIYRATETMERLLKELLELSRIGRLVNPPVAIPLDELVQEARDNVAGQIARGRTEVNIAEDLPTVHGDKPRILEVFQNLIDNAVKYMGDQPDPTVEIGSECRDGATLLYVRDNGIGIRPDYHEKVFGLFNQLDAQAEGTGVGLTLVKRIIEIHGGRVWVESEGNGSGSTFYLTIPGMERA